MDRIGLVMGPIYREEAGRLITALHNLCTIGRARTWKNKYQTRSNIQLTDSLTIFAEIGYSKGKTYFKIEWRPPLFNVEEWQAFINLLGNQFGITYSDLLRRGEVSYLEIAADYEGVDSGDLSVYHLTLKSGGRYPDTELVFRSLYVGHRSHSKCYFHVYARAQRLDPSSTSFLTRIEARYRHIGLPAAALLETPLRLRNEFIPLCVCDRSRARRLARVYGGLGLPFLAIEEELGAHPAFMSVYPASRRHSLMRAFNFSTGCDWWNPEVIWEQVPHAISRALTPAVFSGR